MISVVVCLAFLIPATAACLACAIPTIAALFRRAKSTQFPHPTLSIAILIPAHNEAKTLPRALRSIARQAKVFVVADNCTDRTAEVARDFGATCLERFDSVKTGKGHALAFGLEHVLAKRPDIVLILDADCELNRDAFRHLQAAFASGAEAVQATVYSRNADVSASGYAAAVGSAFDARIAAGRDRLGLTVPLRGTGMAFRRELLERLPWHAFGPVEDAEYARTLRRAGVRVRHCAGAVVSCDAPGSTAALCQQRRRWRAATRLLASKPLVLLHLALTVAVCAAFGVWLWPLGLVLLTASLYLLAIRKVGLTRHRFGLLLGSTTVIARLGWLTLAGLVRKKPSTWERS